MSAERQQGTGRIASSVFAADINVFRPILSPDGNQIVFREQFQGRTYLTVKSLDDNQSFRKALPEDTDLNWHRWAGNGQVLFSVSSLKDYRGQRALLGQKFRQNDLYIIETKSRNSRYVGLDRAAPDGDNVLYVDPDGRYLLLEIRRSIYKYPSVYKIELATGKAEEIIDDQKRVWDWVADSNGVVRMGLSYRRTSTIVYYRSSDKEEFQRVDKVRDKDITEEIREPLLDGFVIVPGSDNGFVLSNQRTGRFALHKFNHRTRELGEQVFAHDKQDISRFAMAEDGVSLQSARFTDSRDRVHWFNNDFAKHQSMLNKALSGQEAWIVSKSQDNSKMIVFSTSAQDPGSFYLYEPSARKMNRFAGANDYIDPSKMAITNYEAYTARDGTIIPAYVTIPQNRNAKGLPLIILPHGGPYGVRDTMDYNWEVQFLANRGYVVLQPNFRGSGSYGEEFYKLGEGSIGRAMQDDLDDGMDWLVERGVVDPKRVCIVGSSYGGYAALWGVTRNPERYRCAASFAGVTDFNRQLRFDRQFFKNRYSRKWREIVEGEDDFDLSDVSPASAIKRLKRPILLVHGKKDNRVPYYSQFTIYKERLEKKGADAVFVTYEDEGHGLSSSENRKDWLNQLEKFLDKHNPA